MSHDVFISYSDSDKDVAQAVCATLESRHIQCWIAPRDVLPGSEWAEAVVDAIDSSPVFVLVLSSASNKSPQVVREVGRAASKGIPIIPFRIDDVSPSKAIDFFVSSHHWLDAQTPPLEKHLGRLADTVRARLGPEHPAREEKVEKVRVEKPPKAEKVKVAKPPEAKIAIAGPGGWFRAGIVLSSIGLGFLVSELVILALRGPAESWAFFSSLFGLTEQALGGQVFLAILVSVLPFLIPGVFCLRRGVARGLPAGSALGAVARGWWLLPVFVGFVGGIVSWMKQKGVNRRAAVNMLALGVLATLLWTIPVLVHRTSVVPPDDSTAQVVEPPSPEPTEPTEPTTPTEPTGPTEPTEVPPEPEEKPLTAADIPELADLVARGQVDGDLVWNPWEDFFVKPDGTPYKIAYTCSTAEVEPMAQAVYMLEDWFPRFGLGTEGRNWITFGAGFSLEAQIDFFEDMAVSMEPDWFMCHSVDIELEVPVVEKMVYELGIPVFTLDCGISSDAVTSFIAHKFEGPGGTDVLARWLVDELQRQGYHGGNRCVVGELWGMREMETSQLRHDGFYDVISDYDWIRVVQSKDTNWAPEQTATIVADMLRAHPDIVAFFHHGCGAPGILDGLESMDKLLPRDDPDHIIITSNDAEFRIWDAILDGTADACASHGGVEPSDVCLQVAMTSVILGQPVEEFYQCPYFMVDAGNIDTIQIGGVPPYPGWPRDRWDVWLPADPEPDYGFPQPSLELRELYMGY
jgi:ABC-type sugar transport system substrate-binding protein